jgi:hypothetical protein
MPNLSCVFIANRFSLSVYQLFSQFYSYFVFVAVSQNQVTKSAEWKAKQASSALLLQTMQNISRNAQLTFGKQMEALASTWICEKTQGFLENNYPQITSEVSV